MRFRDRAQAGREPAERLRARREAGALPDPVVPAPPRGGAAVAREAARALGAPLDVVVVRRIGAPFQEEHGLGAIAEDDLPLLDEAAPRGLGPTEDRLAPAVERERAEPRRRARRHRHGRPAPDPRGRTALVADDGLATGSTAPAVLRRVRGRGPARTVLAVPVGAPEAVEALGEEADEVVCLHRPSSFTAVGVRYDGFGQLTDEEVVRALTHRRRAPTHP